MSFKRLISICSVNEGKAAHLRSFIQNDVDHNQVDRNKPFCFYNCAKFSIVLPPFHLYPPELQEIYTKSVVDFDMKDDLERAKVINWCKTAKPLLPLITTGDGNCLLHAVSLALWGIEDNDQFFRRLLYLTLVNDQRQIFKRRWVICQQYVDPSMPEEANFQLNTAEWEREWEGIKTAASDIDTEHHGQNLPFSPLEGIHLFALANILKRPIIVLADKRARSVYGQSLQESNIAGMYLPLEWKASECCKSPVILGYNQNHFAPLISREDEPAGHAKTADNVVLLINEDYSPLVIHFLLPDEEKKAADIVRDYLISGNVVLTRSGGVAIAAKIQPKPLPSDLDLVKDHRIRCEQIFRNIIGSSQSSSFPPMPGTNLTPSPTKRQASNENENTAVNALGRTVVSIGFAEGMRERHSSLDELVKCITSGCQMFGSPATANLCSNCFKLYTVHYDKEEAYHRQHRPNVKPTAPPPTMPIQESFFDVSMMGELCHEGCGLHCSTETFPYCHECFEQIEKKRNQNIQTPPKQEPRSTNENKHEEMEISEQSMFGSGSSSQQKEKKKDILVNIEPELSPRPQVVCSTPNCNRRASKEPTKKCSECFLHSPVDKQSQKMILRSPPPSEIAGSNNDVSSPLDELGPPLGASLFSEPSIPSPSLKHICATPGCQGVRMNNPTGSCLDCWKRNLGNKARSEPLPVSGPPEYGQLESSVMESCNLLELERNEVNPLVTTSKDKVKCACPPCNNLIYPPKKICDECSTTIRLSFAEKTKNDKKRFSTVPVAAKESEKGSCKTIGCDFFAQPETGYCSACTKKAAKKSRLSSTSEPIVIRSYPGMTDMRVLSAPIARRGKLCIESGCDKFGDPANQDRCSHHYNQMIGAMDFSPATRYNRNGSVNFQPVPPASRPFPQPMSFSAFGNLHGTATVGQYAENPPTQRQNIYSQTARNKVPDFNIALQKVENERKSKMQCRKPACMNYGNNQRDGYCNSCFIEVSQLR